MKKICLMLGVVAFAVAGFSAAALAQEKKPDEGKKIYYEEKKPLEEKKVYEEKKIYEEKKVYDEKKDVYGEKEKASDICKKKGYTGEAYDKCVKGTMGGYEYEAEKKEKIKEKSESGEIEKKKEAGTEDAYIMAKEKAIKNCKEKGASGDDFHACVANELGKEKK